MPKLALAAKADLVAREELKIKPAVKVIVSTKIQTLINERISVAAKESQYIARRKKLDEEMKGVLTKRCGDEKGVSLQVGDDIVARTDSHSVAITTDILLAYVGKTLTPAIIKEIVDAATKSYWYPRFAKAKEEKS